MEEWIGERWHRWITRAADRSFPAQAVTLAEVKAALADRTEVHEERERDGELGVDRVKGHHLWAHFDAIRGQSMRRSPESIRRWNAAVLAAREAAGERRLPNGKHVLLENIFLLDESAKDDVAPGGPCPFLGQEAWVSAEGRFDPCCAPDAQRRALEVIVSAWFDGTVPAGAALEPWLRASGDVASAERPETMPSSSSSKPDASRRSASPALPIASAFSATIASSLN